VIAHDEAGGLSHQRWIGSREFTHLSFPSDVTWCDSAHLAHSGKP
jgi:hypothetical protein